MDSIVQRVAKSQTQLSDFHFHFRGSMGRIPARITVYNRSPCSAGLSIRNADFSSIQALASVIQCCR